MFVPNRLPNLFARQPEMTRPLPTKIGPTERRWDMQSLQVVLSAILSFFNTERICFSFLNWVLPSPAACRDKKWNVEKHCMSIAEYAISQGPRKLSISRKNTNDKPTLQSYKLGEYIIITNSLYMGKASKRL